MNKKCLDLFAGIGGFAIAAGWAGFSTAQFVEIDPRAQKVLRHHYPHAPIHDDVRTYQGKRGEFDIITAGFPCTGTSGAGLKTGFDHAESKLFYEVLRIANDIKPQYLVIENPIGLVTNGLDEVLARLRMAGYSSEIIPVSAARLGAGHRRLRLFIVSYPHVGSGSPTISVCGGSEMRELVSQARVHADWLQVKTGSNGLDDGLSLNVAEGDRRFRTSFRPACKSGVKGRLAARILLGRTVTPQQALIPFLKIKQLMAGDRPTISDLKL